MGEQGTTGRCRPGVLIGVGLSVGVVIGIAVGSAIALGIGSMTIEAMRGLLDRMSGRSNQVNFELLLQ